MKNALHRGQHRLAYVFEALSSLIQVPMLLDLHTEGEVLTDDTLTAASISDFPALITVRNKFPLPTNYPF